MYITTLTALPVSLILPVSGEALSLDNYQATVNHPMAGTTTYQPTSFTAPTPTTEGTVSFSIPCSIDGMYRAKIFSAANIGLDANNNNLARLAQLSIKKVTPVTSVVLNG